MSTLYLWEPEIVWLKDQARDKGHLVDWVEEVQVKVADGVEGCPVKAHSGLVYESLGNKKKRHKLVCQSIFANVFNCQYSSQMQ